MRKGIFRLVLAFVLVAGITGCGKKDYEYYSRKVPKVESQEKLSEMLDEVKDNDKLSLVEKGKVTAIIAKQKEEIELED